MNRREVAAGGGECKAKNDISKKRLKCAGKFVFKEVALIEEMCYNNRCISNDMRDKL
ncbi:MAG: hypothetical protein IJJ76_01355 [Ruminococcus sp.]|uniref:hypothetical protein n=1 Tax=Ruminococcus sp. TaxID=41978 RepID=UPI0025E26EED|nr:hypothetical protein [Ruminococcus sp.]MBR0528397.1 hypothetical protein [Ruminococcus sp.]